MSDYVRLSPTDLKAIQDLTAELKRQRGIDPEAGFADKPTLLTEPEPQKHVIPAENIKGFRTVGDTVFIDIMSPEEGGIAKALQREVSLSTYSPSIEFTGYNDRAMEILRETQEENN